MERKRMNVISASHGRGKWIITKKQAERIRTEGEGLAYEIYKDGFTDELRVFSDDLERWFNR